jgi:cytochrome c oxidase subunit 2
VFDALQNTSKHSGGTMIIDPTKVTQSAPFDKPGVYPNEDGSYDAVVVAYTFGFLPTQDLVVPINTPINFKIASLDVVHGFQIPGVSNVNLEVLPGHVSEVTQSFDEPGRHLILCHEYCGSAHHFMVGHIRVLEEGVTPEEYAEQQAAKQPKAATDAAAADATTDGDSA